MTATFTIYQLLKRVNHNFNSAQRIFIGQNVSQRYKAKHGKAIKVKEEQNGKVLEVYQYPSTYRTEAEVIVLRHINKLRKMKGKNRLDKLPRKKRSRVGKRANREYDQSTAQRVRQG